MATPNKKVEAEMTSIKVNGKTLSIPELNEWLKNGGSMTYPCNNYEALLLMVRDMARTEVGIFYLFSSNRNTRQRCFDLIFDDSVPEAQKVNQIMTIAKLDMVIEALIQLIGNQPIPLLKDWSPVFGLHWQQRARVLITSKDYHNKVWLDTYTDLVKPSVEAKQQVVSMHGDAKLPLQADSVRDVKLGIHEDMLSVSINENTTAFKWKELKWFWDKRGNQRGVNAEILLELPRDLDDCLNSAGGMNRVFGKSGDPRKQISSLSKALDEVVFIQNKRDELATKRWFSETKHREPRWKPLFRFNKGQLSEITQLAKEFVETNATANEIADKVLNNKDSKLSVEEMMSEGIWQHSIKNEKISNEYQNENVGIEEVWVDKK